MGNQETSGKINKLKEETEKLNDSQAIIEVSLRKKIDNINKLKSELDECKAKLAEYESKICIERSNNTYVQKYIHEAINFMKNLSKLYSGNKKATHPNLFKTFENRLNNLRHWKSENYEISKIQKIRKPGKQTNA